MNGKAWNVVEGAFKLLLTATLAVAVSYFTWRTATGQVRRKTVILEMTWKRLSNNVIHLEAPCQSNPEPGCFCSTDFTVTRSKQFTDYIESFGSKTVPIKYDVDYDRHAQIVSAVLQSVGDWPAERFNVVEMTLATGFHPSQNQAAGTVVHHRSKNPADCFPKSD
jgi:hypothetical protein